MRSSWHVSRIKSVLLLFRQHISISRYKYLVSDTDGSVVSQRCADSEAASTSFIQSIVKKNISGFLSAQWDLYKLIVFSDQQFKTQKSDSFLREDKETFENLEFIIPKISNLPKLLQATNLLTIIN